MVKSTPDICWTPCNYQLVRTVGGFTVRLLCMLFVTAFLHEAGFLVVVAIKSKNHGKIGIG